MEIEDKFIEYLEKTRIHVENLSDKYYFDNPGPTTEHGKYTREKNNYWTSSFWLGILQIIDIYGSDLNDVINAQIKSFQNRLDNKVELETHDIGFLYILSAVAHYKIHGDIQSREMLINAAELLMTRYSEKAGIIQAWGTLDDPNEAGRMIIDCLMNIPLLFYASEITGEKRFYDAALKHAINTQKYIVREDFTTFHTYYFDRVSGTPIRGVTAQGYSDDSCWSRGQAWGIYGFALAYSYTKVESFLSTARNLADYFISNLPSDKVAYWDLIFNEGSDEPRDSSASAIAACGMLELAKNLVENGQDYDEYENVAKQIIVSLGDKYSTFELEGEEGLLLHGVYDKNTGKGVDVSTLWGDYFFAEGLARLNGNFIRFW